MRQQHPQQNALVLENGMLKLKPHNQQQEQQQASSSSEPALDLQNGNEVDNVRVNRMATDTLMCEGFESWINCCC